MQKIYRTWFDSLKTDELKQQYKVNFEKQHPELNFEDFLELPCRSMWKFFADGFSFKLSLEGLKYWINIRRKYTGR